MDKPVKVDKRIKQICINGHDVFICGRDSSGMCTICLKEYLEKNKEKIKKQQQENRKAIQDGIKVRIPKVQFCPQGHDTFIEGRTSSGACRKCSNEHVKKRNKEQYPEKKEKIQAKNKKWAEEHKEEVLAYKRQHYKDHPELYRIRLLKSKTNRGLRVVPWGQEGMEEFYKNIPEDMTVEHIIPLQGKLVSGLHVSWNLSYLSKSENSSKNNRCTPEEATKFYEKVLKEAGLK